MSRSVILLVAPDVQRAERLARALAERPWGAPTVTVGSMSEFDIPSLSPDAILIIDAPPKVSVAQFLPDEVWVSRTLVVFADAADPRRAEVLERGALEIVIPPGGPERPLAFAARRLERSEKRVDASRRAFRALVERAAEAVCVLNGPRFVYANQGFESLVGYTTAELTSSDFSFMSLVAEESWPTVKARQARIAQGLSVPTRFEIVARRHDGERFHAEISAYAVDFDGEPVSLALVRDVSDRVRGDLALVRRSRELALLYDLAATVNRAAHVDETLEMSCARVQDLFGAAAAGISLVVEGGETLELRASQGVDSRLVDSLRRVSVHSGTLLADVFRSGEVRVVRSLREDGRVGLSTARESEFGGAVVVPVCAAGERPVGVMFLLTQTEEAPEPRDGDVLLTVGSLLGTALERAALLEQERAAVRRLTVIDEIALAVSSSLDLKTLSEAVALNLQRFLGPERVLIADFDEVRGVFDPICLRDGDVVVEDVQGISCVDSLLGRAREVRAAVQRVWNVNDSHTTSLPPDAAEMFAAGLRTVVAVPIVLHEEVIGGMLLGYRRAEVLPIDELGALSILTTHVAIAMNNATLFADREHALEDLTAAQQRLVQGEKLRALGEMAAGVAHDFNNVLSAILGRVALLGDGLVNPDAVRHLEVVRQAAEDGAETVRRIQELGRNDAPDDTPVPIETVVRDAVEYTRPRWEDPGRPKIHMRIDGVADVWVRGRPSELREVLVNLIHNASDAMPNGGRLTLRVRKNDDIITIQVIDTGTGIPDEIRSRVFDPFFTTKGARGTGLGLSVSARIIERHRGEMSVSSSQTGPEQGTVFGIRLPAIEAPSPRPVPRVRPSSSGSLRVADLDANKAKPRVLVIDDEENIREMLTDILESGGLNVVAVADGHAALERFRSDRFDLVLTDLGLPEMNGYEVAAAVRAIDPDVPVGLVTGWGANLSRNAATAAGIELVLTKPFRFDQVIELVESALGRRPRPVV